MQSFDRVAVLGAGVIGASWTALFLAHGLHVDVFEPAPDGESSVRDYIREAWPTLQALGVAERGDPEALTFHNDAGHAVKAAQFVQENVPERLAVKHALFAAIEPHLAPEAIVASSASGLMVSEMQAAWKDPSRFMLGHPFNPPHLIPLVELLVNDRTADGVLETAEAFYAQVSKVTIRVMREVPAHVSNRLQAALWREAIHLVQSGVATVEDVDKAVWAGPGLRWAAMGPTMLFHLAAGAGGLPEFYNRYGDSFNRWWDDLGTPVLDDKLAKQLADGIDEQTRENDVTTAAAERDAMIVAMLNAKKDVSN